MAKNLKVVSFWVFGAVCIFIAIIILSQLSTTNLYALSLVISFLLILFGGLFWISVAIAARE